MMPSVGSRRKEKLRETRKKRPPRSCNFETAASRACAENHCCNYYTKFPAKCKPNLDGRGGFLMMSGWALVFMTIGVGWAVAQLFRVIDWLEG